MKLAFLGLLGVMANPVVCRLDAGELELPAEAFSKLNAEAFQERELAQADLLAWARIRPAESMDALFRQSRKAVDPETRERCLAVLRDLVNDEYLREGEGYIGIRMQDELANVPGDAGPRAAIRVLQVVENSAAEKAGLRVNDLIVGLGDQVWTEGGASLPFTGVIRQLKPNSKISLQVLREGKVMAVEVTLGRRPLIADSVFPDEREIDLEGIEKSAKEAYFRRWLAQRKLRD
jgi:predicted metalloprotease with PDZ domain